MDSPAPMKKKTRNFTQSPPDTSPPKKKGELTAKARAFALAYPGHGDGLDVAISVGYSKNRRSTAVTVCTLLKDPRVQEILAQKQAAAAKETGKRQGRAITITRNDIIMKLADLADLAESESARVSALGHLKDIFGLSAKNDKDTDMFAGWSREELDAYAVSGEFPERIRSGVSPSEG